MLVPLIGTGGSSLGWRWWLQRPLQWCSAPVASSAPPACSPGTTGRKHLKGLQVEKLLMESKARKYDFVIVISILFFFLGWYILGKYRLQGPQSLSPASSIPSASFSISLLKPSSALGWAVAIVSWPVRLSLASISNPSKIPSPGYVPD